LRHALGLDEPLYAQYGRYLARLAHGDLGQSLKNRGKEAGTSFLGSLAHNLSGSGRRRGRKRAAVSVPPIKRKKRRKTKKRSSGRRKKPTKKRKGRKKKTKKKKKTKTPFIF